MSQDLLSQQLADGFREVVLLNRAMANSVSHLSFPEQLKAIANQCKRVAEEVEETYTAALNADRQELLDGACDILVTADWLVYLIQSVIGDVGSAMSDVCLNNALKYTNDYAEAQSWLVWYQSEYDPNKIGEEYYISTATVDDLTYYAIKRRSDNKFMKPPRHPKVELARHLYPTNEA